MADQALIDGKLVTLPGAQQPQTQQGPGAMIDGKFQLFKPPSSRYDPNLPSDVPDEGGEGFFTDTAKAVKAGFLSSIYHGGDVVRRIFGQPRVIDTPEVQKAITPPDTTYGSLGFGAEQMAETFAPIPGVQKLKLLGEGKGIIRRALTYGAKDAYQNAVVSGIQSGADPTTVGGATAAGAAVGALTGGGGALYDRAAKLTQDVDPLRFETSEWGKAHGYTVDPATRTGNRMVANTKKGLESGINAGDAEELSALQSQEHTAAGRDLLTTSAGLPPGTATNVGGKAQAGRSGYKTLADVAEDYRQQAKQHFGGFRAQEQMMSPTQLPYTSWEMAPTGAVNAQGMPISVPRQVQKVGYFKIPVDRTQLQRDLRGLVSQMGGTMDPTIQSQNPALNIMNKIIHGDSVVDASKALQDLTMMYDTFKLQPGQISRDVSQFIGSTGYQEYRGAVDRAIKATNPALLDLVNQGRAAVGEQHAVQDLMQDLAGRVKGDTAYRPTNLKPAKVYKAMVMDGDANIPLLQDFARRAPDRVPEIASTYLQSLLEKSSDSGAAAHSFTNAKTVLTQWQRMGPETKNILFGPALSKDLDNFFRIGKYLSENPNASNTGVQVWMAARFAQLLTHPTGFLKGVAVEKALGQYIFSDKGPLPYIKERSPGIFGVNPVAAAAGATWRLMTGTDPAQFHNSLEKMQPKRAVESTPNQKGAGTGQADKPPPVALNVNSDGSAKPGFMAQLGSAASRVLRSDISNPEYSPEEQNIRNAYSRFRPPAAPLPPGATLTDPDILHRAEMERQLAHPQGIVDATTGPLIQAAQQTPVGQFATAALRAVAKPSDMGNILHEIYQADVPMIGRRPEFRADITGPEVLAEAAKGPGKFGGFGKYIERNPTAGEDLFDTSNAQPAISGRPPVPRYDPTQGRGRGYSQRAVDAFANPKVINGLKKYIRMGAKELPQDWYANDPLFKVYQREWGDRAEEKFFQQMAYQAATSQGASVPDNIKIGSLYNYMHEQGLEFPKLVEMVPGEKPKLNIAPSYGHDKQLGHLRTAENFRDTGAIDALGNPKRASFTENFMGNEDALTADRHFMRLIGMLSEDPRFLKTTAVVSRGGVMVKVKPQQLFHEGKMTMQEALGDANMWEDRPNKNEYLYLEKMFRDKIAKPLKLTVADSQGKAWVGARRLTGMDSPVNTWINLLKQRIQYTADRLGADPQMILTKFVKGEIPLLQVGGAAAGLGVLGTMGQGDQAAKKENAGAMQ